MALAKVYDTQDTLMVPIDAEGSDSLSEMLRDAAAVLSTIGPLVLHSAPLRDLAAAIDDARTAAGLDT